MKKIMKDYQVSQNQDGRVRRLGIVTAANRKDAILLAESTEWQNKIASLPIYISAKGFNKKLTKGEN